MQSVLKVCCVQLMLCSWAWRFNALPHRHLVVILWNKPDAFVCALGCVNICPSIELLERRLEFSNFMRLFCWHCSVHCDLCKATHRIGKP